MKKFLSYFLLCLCVALGLVSFVACNNSSVWLKPVFTYGGDELTVEFVDNTQQDFDFPIEGRKLDYSKFADERILEYSWVIYNGEREIVGWIEAGGGYEIDKKGNYQYGYSPSTNNGVYGFSNADICLVLKSTDLTVFDRVQISSDCGAVAKSAGIDNNPMSGSYRFTHYDEANNQMIVDAGAEDFVCCIYKLELEGIDSQKSGTINITITLQAE